MRSRIVLAILATGCLVIGTMLVVRQNNPHTGLSPQETIPSASLPQNALPAEPQAASSGNIANEAASVEAITVSNAVMHPASGASNPAANTQEATKAAREAYVTSRISTLQDLAMDNASSSLDTILSELTNNDPQIRKAALEATIQFASRDAIPRLTEVAAETQDAEEKAALNEAIEFLKLPSLTEVLAANKNTRPVTPVKAARPGSPAQRAPLSIHQ